MYAGRSGGIPPPPFSLRSSPCPLCSSLCARRLPRPGRGVTVPLSFLCKPQCSPRRFPYSPSANSRDNTSAFFAIFVALCQSLFRMASRAASMNPRIFDAKSACAAFNAFPRVATRFRSAASRLACASAFAACNSPVESSGTMVGSLGFPAVTGSVTGDAATFGLAGGFRGGPSRAGIATGSSPSSGASRNAPSAVGDGITGCASTRFSKCAAGRFFTRHPPQSIVPKHTGSSRILGVRILRSVGLGAGFLGMLTRLAATRSGTSFRGQPPK